MEECQRCLLRVSELVKQVQGQCQSLRQVVSSKDALTLEININKASKLLDSLKQSDQELQRKMTSLPASLAQKQLKNDYTNRLNVASTVRDCSNLIGKCTYALERASKHRQFRSAHPVATTEVSNQQLLIREYDEKPSDETDALRHIAKDSLLVKEMASELGSMLAIQQDDINKLDENTNDSVSKAIDGVNELTKSKMKQADSGTTKASIGSAALGGLVGMLGGPIGIVLGASAGALVGYGTGRGMAAVKKRSIDAEIRRIKTLLTRGHQINKKGERCIEVKAFEIQSWSMLERRWVPYIWTDDNNVGTLLNPEKATCEPHQARFIVFASARANCTEGSPDDCALKASMEEEVQLNLNWTWANPKWTMVIDREECDLAGWEFATSTSSMTWYKDASQTCMARRRLWVKYLIGSLPKPERDTIQTSFANSTATSLSENDELVEEILRNSLGTNEIMVQSLYQVNEQGEQITRSDRNATIVGDISLYAERIDRASRLSGAVKNMLSRPTVGSTFVEEQVVVQRQEREPTVFNDPLDQTCHAFEENLRISKIMKHEIDVQNLQLDRTTEAVERGNQGMLKITKTILK